jgi:hypothetical protein
MEFRRMCMQVVRLPAAFLALFVLNSIQHELSLDTSLIADALHIAMSEDLDIANRFQYNMEYIKEMTWNVLN